MNSAVVAAEKAVNEAGVPLGVRMSTLFVIAGLALAVVAAFAGGGILLLALGVGLMWAGLIL